MAETDATGAGGHANGRPVGDRKGAPHSRYQLSAPDLGGPAGREGARAVMALRQFRCMVPTLLREEVRMQIAYTSRWAFSMFILLIFLFSLATGLLWSRIIDRMSPEDIHFMVHMSVLMFSFILGLAALSEVLSTSQRFLVADMVRHPVMPRVARAALLARETLFSLTFLFTPLALGIALSLPFSGRNPEAAAVHLSGLLLTFLLGLSLGFALMAVVTAPARWVLPWLLLTTPLAAFVALFGPSGAVLPGYRLSQLWITEGRLATPLLLPGTYMPFALMVPGILHMGSLTASVGQQRSKMAEVTARLPFGAPRADLVALEYLQLSRSRGFQKIIGSYLFPLVIMSIMMLYVKLALGPVIETGITFYVPLVGLISTTIYSWENNVDTSGHFSLVPVSMAEVIRAKLLLFYGLACVFSTAYVLPMAVYLMATPAEVAFAVPAAVLLSIYTGTVTAYLTGINPNRKLFDPAIMARFFAMVSLPLMALLVSAQRPVETAPLVSTIMALLLLSTLLMWRRLVRRWGREPFGD